ncbi:MAG: Bax inhibitor-1 family protein [Planctomycetota bacterium]
MSQGDTLSANPYASFGASIADAPADARAAFIRKTYTHLAIAVYAFAALIWFYFTAFDLDAVLPQLFATTPWMPAIIFGGFMIVSWVANAWAQSSVSLTKQYAGLSLYVVAESLFMLPLLWYASKMSLQLTDGAAVGVIPAAGLLTVVMFGGLSAIAWFSGKDFSFMGAGLGIAGIGIFGLIIASLIFGMNLGVWFSVGMVVFASAYILYETSNVMRHYRPGQHVAASLALFASVALLFFYILRILIAISGRD